MIRLPAAALSLVAASTALAGGAPALHVQEMSVKGVPSSGPYLRAINLRGPMLATCYGSREVMEASKPFEAYIEVSKDGTPRLVNIQAAAVGSAPDLDACLMMQLDKVRFPEGERVVELSIELAPAPKVEPKEEGEEDTEDAD